MSEEVQEIQEEQQTPEAGEPSVESTGEASASASSKKKKINRLSKDELEKKIRELEDKKQTHSKYYKHLIGRKKELETA